MSEQLKHSGERGVESLDTSAELKRAQEQLIEAAERAEKDPIAKHIESLQKSVEAQAVSGAEHNVGDTKNESSNQSFGYSQQLKVDGYKRTIRKVQNEMNFADRTFSKVVHQPLVESVSNGLARTVARPSVFFGGSLGALLGSGALLYMSRENGFTYNYSVFLVTFIGGFLLGGLLELIYNLIFKRRS